MTNYEYFKSLSKKDLSKWIDRYGDFDGSPWMKWWDENYCKKCESEYITYPKENKFGFDPDRKYAVSYCELYGNCRFFKDKKECPNMEQIVGMWMDDEYKETT